MPDGEDMPERRSRHHKHQSKRSSAAYPDVQKHRQESFQQVAYEGQRTAPESAVGVCIVGAGVAVGAGVCSGVGAGVGASFAIASV